MDQTRPSLLQRSDMCSRFVISGMTEASMVDYTYAFQAG
jgi:hypothetical protein